MGGLDADILVNNASALVRGGLSWETAPDDIDALTAVNIKGTLNCLAATVPGMLYPDGKRKNHWRAGQSVPDVSRPETKLWFYFLAASYIDLGCEAIHFGQAELMRSS